MAITFDKGVFLLSSPKSTYVMRLHEGRYLVHCGWFSRIETWTGACDMPLAPRSFAPETDGTDKNDAFSLDVVKLEYPAPCGTDFRASAFKVSSLSPAGEDGEETISGGAELLYKEHRIYKGKHPLPSLPATYTEDDSEADTLEIDLGDPVTGLTVTLVYTVWNTFDVICRHAVFCNKGDRSITLLGAMSASVDFDGEGMRLLTLSGAHARERHPVIRAIEPGTQGVISRRGMTGHQQNPFMAILSSDATERQGTVYGMSLVYSGEFEAIAKQDQFGTNRVQIGIGNHNFRWTLEPSCAFTTPECVMVRSCEGLCGMSHTYHELYRTRLCRGKWRDKERPVVINNWEATYFDFDEEKLLRLADTAAKTGVECFVLDDGWFGHRRDDRRALGDWDVNTAKLPHGLKGLADEMHRRSMMFGLWVEPEMVSPDSNLYRAHPAWCIHSEGRPKSLSRHQLVLDLSLADVVDYLIGTFTGVLSSAAIDYIKWDFNRSPAWFYPGQAHKYYLGLYHLLEVLTSRFPDVLFESCAGGGGRFDAGMLYYMPQTWTSDNTDAISRVSIQAGTSLAYPASCMSCHVSAVPNHQTGRITPLQVRGAVAMAGAFGYELDLNRLSETEQGEIKDQIAWYKKVRPIVQFGSLYRIKSPYMSALIAGGNNAPDTLGWSAWEHVAKDKKAAAITIVWTYAEANAPFIRVKLQGLNAKDIYRFSSLKSRTTEALLKALTFEAPTGTAPVPDGTEASGEELMNAGLCIACSPTQGGSIQLYIRAL